MIVKHQKENFLISEKMNRPRRRGIWPWEVSPVSIDCPNCIIFSPDCTAADCNQSANNIIQVIKRCNQGNNKTKRGKETPIALYNLVEFQLDCPYIFNNHRKNK